MRKLIQKDEKGFTLVELMIVVAIIGILAAVAIPNFISYRNKAFCSGVESDANNVAASIADYFSIPTHTNIDDASYKAYATTFKPAVNTYTISATAVNTAITITVTDASGRCPADYRTANPINAAGDGWAGMVYQKVLSQ